MTRKALSKKEDDLNFGLIVLALSLPFASLSNCFSLLRPRREREILDISPLRLDFLALSTLDAFAEHHP